MKFRFGAAAIAVALTVVPGALFALQTTSSVTAYDYNATAKVVFGVTSTWQRVEAKYVAATFHTFVDNPDLIPTGACRDIANRWNMNILGGKSSASFESLLQVSADNNCKLQCTRTTVANADGSYDLTAVAPTP